MITNIWYTWNIPVLYRGIAEPTWMHENSILVISGGMHLIYCGYNGMQGYSSYILLVYPGIYGCIHWVDLWHNNDILGIFKGYTCGILVV